MTEISINTRQLLSDVLLMLPEVALVISIILIIIGDLFLSPRRSYLTSIFAIIGLVLSFNIVIFQLGHIEATTIFWGMLYVDKFALYFKFLFILATFLTVLFSVQSKELFEYKTGEYFAALMTATLGMCLLAGSRNLLMFYLALETMSLSCYILAGYLKRDRFSAEAGLKYVIYGAVASAVMLFGFSYLFGLTGSLDIPEIFEKLGGNKEVIFAVLLLVLVGIGFKISMVPFHFWAPDVYQGAPTPITAYLSVASKIAGFAGLFRVFLPFFKDIAGELRFAGLLLNPDISWLFWVFSVATMSLGNLVAIRQTDIKRLFAYSSIAHAGYMLMGMTVLNRQAMEAMLFYFFAYFLMNLGVFCIIVLLINKTGSADIRYYQGLVRQFPFMVASLTIILFSLTGLPPLVGFPGKFHLFRVVVDAGLSSGRPWFYSSLVLIGVFNTVVSLYYYMKIIKIMVFERGLKEIAAAWEPVDSVMVLIFIIPILYFGLFWGGVYTIIEKSILGVLI